MPIKKMAIFGVDPIQSEPTLAFVMSFPTPYKTTLVFVPKSGQNRFKVETYRAHMMRVSQSICMSNHPSNTSYLRSMGR